MNVKSLYKCRYDFRRPRLVSEVTCNGCVVPFGQVYLRGRELGRMRYVTEADPRGQKTRVEAE